MNAVTSEPSATAPPIPTAPAGAVPQPYTLPPPAPTTFDALPAEMIAEIAREVPQPSDPYASLRDLESFMNANFWIGQVLQNDPQVERQRRQLHDVMAVGSRFWQSTLAEHGGVLTPAAITALAPVMSLLDPQQRAQIVEAAVTSQGVETWAALQGPLANLGPLDERQRSRLVAHALAQDSSLKGDTLGALRGQYRHLTAGERDAVFDSAMKLRHDSGRSQAIAGMGRDLDLFSPLQQSTMMGEAQLLDTPHLRTLALRGLAEGLQHLSPPLKDYLFSAQDSITEGRLKKAFGEDLLRQYNYLNPNHQGSVVQDLLRTSDGHPFIGKHLDAVISSLDEEQKAALVKAVFQRPASYERVEAAASLLQVLGSFAAPERRQIMESMWTWTDTEFGLALSRIGAQTSAWDESLKLSVIDRIARMTPGRLGQAEALGGLGGGLDHFTPEQRDALLSLASAMPQPQRNNALEGLSRGIAAFTPAQRDVLHDAIFRPNQRRLQRSLADTYVGLAENVIRNGAASFEVLPEAHTRAVRRSDDVEAWGLRSTRPNTAPVSQTPAVAGERARCVIC